jgi:hypothetical protein
VVFRDRVPAPGTKPAAAGWPDDNTHEDYAMSDPRFQNIPPPGPRDQSYGTWVVGIIIVILIIVAVAYGMRNRSETASTGTPQTTGQGMSPGAPAAPPRPGAPATNR